jgi:hypothetical protein
MICTILHQDPSQKEFRRMHQYHDRSALRYRDSHGVRVGWRPGGRRPTEADREVQRPVPGRESHQPFMMLHDSHRVRVIRFFSPAQSRESAARFRDSRALLQAFFHFQTKRIEYFEGPGVQPGAGQAASTWIGWCQPRSLFWTWVRVISTST